MEAVDALGRAAPPAFASGTIVAILDFDDDPELYSRHLPPDIQVKCLLLNHTAKFSGQSDLSAAVPVDDLAIATVGILWHTISAGKELLDAMPLLKLLIRVGVGTDNVDLAEATARGVWVANIPDYGTEDVADSALSHILNLLRKTSWQIMQVREGLWEPRGSGALRVRGKVLGLLGFGRIGKALALRSKPLGMEVVFFDPYRPPGEDKALGVRQVDTLEALLRQSDVVSVHCDLNSTTRHLLNKTTLGLMKKGSFLVNTARGGIVETSDLQLALQSGHLAGAGLDVLEEEPPSGQVSLLTSLPSLELTPHCAFFSAEAWEEMRTKAAQEALRYLTGQPLRSPVNCPAPSVKGT
eukprot:RCo012792